jgi:hypothetical protein
VVCLFSNGHDYQIKDWPHQQKFVELFLRIRGFFVQYDDCQIPDVVKKWNIKRLPIKRSVRHKDNFQAEAFWKEMESFLRKPKFGGMELKKS